MTTELMDADAAERCKLKHWTFLDRSAWGGSGAEIAKAEPDRAQWVDPDTGLACLMVRHAEGAHWCGYVGVPPGHPWHGVEYSSCTLPDAKPEGLPDKPRHGDEYTAFEREWAERKTCGEPFCDHQPQSNIDVHGGLTFSDKCSERFDEETGRPEGVCHIAEPGTPDDVWWFGFDCAHLNDSSPGHYRRASSLAEGFYKDAAYVMREVRNLARQLAEVRDA